MNISLLYRKRKQNRPNDNTANDTSNGPTVAQGSFEDQYYFYDNHPDSAQQLLEDDDDWQDWSEEYDDIIAQLESAPALDTQRRYLSLLQSGSKDDGSNISNPSNYFEARKISKINKSNRRTIETYPSPVPPLTNCA